MTVFSALCAFLKGRGLLPVVPVVEVPETPIIAPSAPPERLAVTDTPQFSDAGMALLKAMESCRLQAYDDATGEPVKFGNQIKGTLTIGLGHTGPDVVPGLVWTEAQCESAMLADLAPIITGLRRIITRGLTDHEFSALVSLAYNAGFTAVANSALNGGTLAAVNLGQFGTVPNHIASWNQTVIGGVKQVSPGLVGRRAAEVALWNLEGIAPIPDFAAIRDQAVINYRNQTIAPLTA